MTQDEIIEMAKKVYGDTNWTEASLSRLECFAKLAVANEREACAKLVGEFAQNYSAYELATIIRARGQAST
jgi:hypothetical protein